MNRRKFVETSITLLGAAPLTGLALPMRKFKPVRFGIITDTHYAERSPANNRYYAESLMKVRECVDLMNEQKVDFLIELGDLKDEGNPPVEADTLRFLSSIERELQRFQGPLYHVLGNHDHDSISKQQFLNGIKNFGFSKATNYYSFNQGSFHFVVLDANYTADGREYDHGNFDWKDAHIPAEQLNWLQKDLNKNNMPTIVFVHQQLDAPAFDAGHHIYCPNNAADTRKILEDSGRVIGLFQGHFHEGSLNTINHIYYYTLKAVIEGSGPEHNNYAIVEIGKDLTTHIKGYRKTASQILKKGIE